MTRLIMLEIGGLGFLRAVRPSSRKLRTDVSLLIVDELNKTLWLWMGSSIKYDKRRTVQSKVDEISKDGYRLGDQVIGQGMRVVVVDQDHLESPETARLYSSLTAMLDEPMEISTITNVQGTLIYATLSSGTGTSPQIVSEKPSVFPTPDTTESVQASVQRPRSPSISKGTRFALEAALMAILRVHQEVHIHLSQSGDTEELTISAIDGLQHKLKRQGKKISFKWDSKTPKELKDLVALELKNLTS